jgi:hypothetical protein
LFVLLLFPRHQDGVRGAEYSAHRLRIVPRRRTIPHPGKYYLLPLEMGVLPYFFRAKSAYNYSYIIIILGPEFKVPYNKGQQKGVVKNWRRDLPANLLKEQGG